jgi:glutathione S-transferase
MRERILTELVARIGDGPFMGELDQPSMLDFAVFPQLVFGYMFGLEEQCSAANYHLAIKDWLKRVADHLPKNPVLAADRMQIKALSGAFA